MNLKGQRKLIAFIIGLILVTVLTWLNKISSEDASKIFIFAYMFYMGGNSIEHIDISGATKRITQVLRKNIK